MRLSLVTALLCTLAASPLSAATYIPIPPVAGSWATYATAINDKNTIAGFYLDATGAHGFIGTLDGNYQTFDAGAATLVWGLDKAGDVVGFSSSQPDPSCDAEPFERGADGTVKRIKMDGAKLNGAPSGMNAKGDFVGFYCDGDSHPFGYIGRKGKYVEGFELSGVHMALLTGGINAAHTITGTTDVNGAIKGFMLKDGTTSYITYPGASQTFVYGLNDKDVVVGSYSVGGGQAQAFLLDSGKGKFEAIGLGARSIAVSVNNAGLVVLSTDSGPFIYCPKKPDKCPASAVRSR